MRAAALAFLVASSFVACSRPEPREPTGGDTDPGMPDACNAIVLACHDVDPVGAVEHRCHELGHSVRVTADECHAAESECVAACDQARARTAR